MNLAFVYALIPVLKKLYPRREELAAALKRHLVFFNTTPHIVTLLLGITTAMEEKNSQQKNMDATAIDNVKASLMGPLAGLGDSFFWGTLRLIATGIGTSLALKGNILGPILFLYKEYLSLQCDSAVRNIVRIYPYDVAPGVDTTGDGLADEGSLRGSSETVASRIRDEIQKKVSDAGIEIIEARITYLAYAPEIAAVMLQRQQASAIIDARKMIVDGAVGMVEMALERLEESGSVQLDEERKAAMVSNLLVVLCGNRDAQPIVNSGSLY